MNNPDSLLRIAEKACDFDRVHFANGNVSTAETLASCHERLATDPKLITRLLFRHAVVLAFFEGYVQAVDDCANATESQSIGIVKKPPPPPPSAAPPKPEEISDELAQAAADYSNRIGKALASSDDLRRARRLATYASESTSWEASIQDFIEGARWQLARTPSMPANEVQDSERAQYEKTIELANTRCNELQSELSETENERLTMKNERDRALAKVRVWEARTGETNPLVVAAKNEDVQAGSLGMSLEEAIVRYGITTMPSDREIVDLICRTVYDNLHFPEHEIERVVDAMNGDSEDLRCKIGMYNGLMAEVCAIKFALLHFLKSNPQSGQEKSRIEELESKLASCKETIAATAVQAAEWRDRAERNNAVETQSTTDPIVFRNENERDFWDEQVHALNRKGNRSARDVASAADEMVGERRKRIPTVASTAGEISDELLLEGAMWANSVCDMASAPDDLVSAMSAMNGNTVFELRWSNAVRSYVSGAIRKALKIRKT